MTAVDLIICPYDCGRRNWRCGLGPERILRQDAIARIEAAGTNIRLVEIESQVSYQSEPDLMFEAQRQIAERTADACASGRLPVVLAGNCNTAVGGASGIGGNRRGLVWFDAHGDFCTPETTDSGFLDGMGLAMLTGRCWSRALSRTTGYAPIADTAVALVGARDLDPWEIDDLKASAITELRTEAIRANGVAQAFQPFLQKLARQVDRVYVHIDLDVHDPQDAPANHYNAPDGLRPGEVGEAVALIGRHVRIAGAGFASYDPSFDPHGKTAAVAVALLHQLIAAGSAA